MGIVVGILTVGGLLLAGWWLLIETEGVYLGQRVVTLLYDLYAHRYEKIKEFQPEYEYFLLARPIMGEIAPQIDPLVLDVGTGTGRLPAALYQHELFAGFVIATDISRNMLTHAADKLKDETDRVVFARCAGEHLPFADDCFDVVTCLEALEFMADPALALCECIRVLKPGGLLLISNRMNVRMPGRLWTDEQLHTLLAEYGVNIAQTEVWQVDYTRVLGLKDQP